MAICTIIFLKLCAIYHLDFSIGLCYNLINEREVVKMIEEFINVSSDTMSTLLDIYQMKDWGVTWVEFLEKFTEVILDTIGEWQCEEIN